MKEKQLFVKPMLVELNITTGGKMLTISEEDKMVLYNAILHYGHLEFRSGIETVENDMAQSAELEELLQEKRRKINNMKNLIKDLLEIKT